MSRLKIKDMPPVEVVDGTEIIPTGGKGDVSVTVERIKNYVYAGTNFTSLSSQLQTVDLRSQNNKVAIDSHIADLLNPHQVTKAQVGLGNVDNTSDLNKPISIATQGALTALDNIKANTTYVDAGLNVKANITYVDDNLALKSDITYVDTALANKTHNSLVGRDVANAHPTSAIVDASGKTQQEINDSQALKNAQIVHAKDIELVGDGSDETAKLVTLLANNIVILEKDKVYGFNQALVPENIIIFANNAKLKALTNFADWVLKFQTDVQIIGTLNIEVPSGYGARVYGDNFKADEINVVSLTDSVNFGFQVQTGNAATYVENCNIGKVTTKNFLSQQQFFRVKNSKFGTLICNNYRTGVYLRDIQDTQIDYVEAKLMRAGSSGGSGENGFLAEATIDNKTMRNVKIGKIHVEDSAEHGVRFGGLYTIQCVNIGDIYTKNTGASPTSTGGSGVKLLGGNNARPLFNYHEDITIGTITNVDCQVGTGVNNFSAFTVSHCKNVKVGVHTVRKENNAAFSAKRGLQVTCSENVSIGTQDYEDTQINGVWFYQGEAPEMDVYDIIKDVYLPNYNSLSVSTNSASIYFNVAPTKVSNILINGSLVQDVYVRAETQTTGTITGVNINIRANPYTVDTTGKAPPLQCANTTNGVVVNVFGKWFGSYGPTCSDGSTYFDPTQTTTFRFRTAGAWKSPTLA